MGLVRIHPEAFPPVGFETSSISSFCRGPVGGGGAERLGLWCGALGYLDFLA